MSNKIIKNIKNQFGLHNKRIDIIHLNNSELKIVRVHLNDIEAEKFPFLNHDVFRLDDDMFGIHIVQNIFWMVFDPIRNVQVHNNMKIGLKNGKIVGV